MEVLVMLFSDTQKIIPATRLISKGFLALGLAFIFLTAVLMSGCVVHHHGHGYKQGHGNIHYAAPAKVKSRVALAVPAPVAFTFTDHHRHTVRNYYHRNPHHHHGKKHKWKKKWKNKGRGHGRDHLPPGLARRDVLPPGIQMQAVHGNLVHQLPHVPRGTRYIYHEDQVLLIDVNTRVVLDFINISVSAEY